MASSLAPDDGPPAIVVLDVPELDWSIPEAPTVRAPKVTEPESDVVYTGYYAWIVAEAPANSTFWQERPFVPVVPDDDILPMPRYQHPLLLFDRLCRQKGPLRDHVGFYRESLIAAMRADLLIFTIGCILYEVYPIPGLILQAWRAFKDAQRPYVPRTWREVRRLRNRR